MSYKDKCEDEILYYSGTIAPKHYRISTATKNVGHDADSVELFQAEYGTDSAIYFMLGEIKSKYKRLFTDKSEKGLLKAKEDCFKIIQACYVIDRLLGYKLADLDINEEDL